MVVTKKLTNLVLLQRNQYFLPKTNDKNCIGTMNFISMLPLLPLRVSSPPTLGRGGSGWRITNIPPLVVGGMVWQYTKIHTLLLWLTPKKDQVGHRCHLHSISGFSPEKDCIGVRPWEMREPSGWCTDLALGWQQRQCWQQEELRFAGSFLMISYFWRQEGKGEGRTSNGTWCTCCGNEKRGPLSMGLTMSVRGARQWHEHW